MPEDVTGLVELLLEATALKWTARTGWRMRGVPEAESVAEHSYGVALVSLALADVLKAGADADAGLDLARLLPIALLHDLPEVRLTDLPASAVRLVGSGVKRQAEASALRLLLEPFPSRERLWELWHEFEDASSPEGRLVRDADKLEMMLQCLRYEQAGFRGLGEFWRVMDLHDWYYPLSAQLYAELKKLRLGMD
jgi:putative hydrolases of HD superfamily